MADTTDHIVTSLWGAGSRNQIFERKVARVQEEIAAKDYEYRRHNALQPSTNHLSGYVYTGYHQTRQRLNTELEVLQTKHVAIKQHWRNILSKSIVAANKERKHLLTAELANLRASKTPLPHNKAASYYSDSGRHQLSDMIEPLAALAPPLPPSPEPCDISDPFEFYGIPGLSLKPLAPCTPPTTTSPTFTHIPKTRSVRRLLFQDKDTHSASTTIEHSPICTVPLPTVAPVDATLEARAPRLPNPQQDDDLGNQLADAFDQLLNFDPGEANALLALVQRIRIAMAYILLLPLAGLDMMEVLRYGWWKTVIVWYAAVLISMEAWRHVWWETVVVWCATVIGKLRVRAMNDDEGE